MRPCVLVAAGLLACLGLQPALAQQPPGAPPPAGALPDLDEEYRIGPEDVLAISVWNNPAMSREVPVRPDGRISLPLVDDVQAAGLTPMQLRDVLVRKLADYVPRPAISVIVTDVRSFKVSVLGEVVTQGRFELKSGATILDVIALAGGFNEYAARTRIVVLRLEGDRRLRIPFNYNHVVEGRNVELLALQPGDIIIVP